MIIVIKNNFILFEKKSCQNRNSHPWLLFCCLFGFCLLSLTFSLATSSSRLSGFRGLFTRPAVTFSSPLSLIPPPSGEERGGKTKKKQKKLVFPYPLHHAVFTIAHGGPAISQASPCPAAEISQVGRSKPVSITSHFSDASARFPH